MRIDFVDVDGQARGRSARTTHDALHPDLRQSRASQHSLASNALRRFGRMVINSILAPVDEARFAADRSVFDAKGAEVVRELQAARTLLAGAIEQGSVLAHAKALVRMDSQIEAVQSDYRRHLNEEIDRLLPLLGAGDSKSIPDGLRRVDALRDELNLKTGWDPVGDAWTCLRSDAAATLRNQHQVILISVVLTVLAALLGLVFATLVSTGMIRPVRRLLEGTRAVEAGKLDETIVVTSTNEIGQLTAAFKPDGRAAAPQGAHPPNFRQVHRSAHCREPDRPARPCRRRGAASRDDRIVLRHEGLYRCQ